MIQENVLSTKTIPLTRGKIALVDAEDYDFLMKWHWCCSAQGYAKRGEKVARASYKTKTIMMHRQIMKAKRGQEVDHINGHTLDNRKSNLRFCNHEQNCHNRHKIRAKQGYLGVGKNGKNGFMARLLIDRKCIYLGTYRTPEEAARAFDAEAFRRRGQFARLNFPTEEATQCEQV